MELRNLPFEQPMILRIKNHDIELIAFKTTEDGNIKFGINAPTSINVDREEIYLKKRSLNYQNTLTPKSVTVRA